MPCFGMCLFSHVLYCHALFWHLLLLLPSRDAPYLLSCRLFVWSKPGQRRKERGGCLIAVRPASLIQQERGASLIADRQDRVVDKQLPQRAASKSCLKELPQSAASKSCLKELPLRMLTEAGVCLVKEA